MMLLPLWIFFTWRHVAPAVLSSVGVQRVYPEIYRSTHFYQQFAYNQQLPRILDLRFFFFVKTSLIEANVHRQYCICRQTNSTLVVLSLVRNITVYYTRQWHSVIGATYIAIPISELPLPRQR